MSRPDINVLIDAGVLLFMTDLIFAMLASGLLTVIPH
jgi:hypothetical protein